MGQKDNRCLKPEKLRGKPQECEPEQIRECHGDSRKHLCVAKKKKK